MKAAGWPPRCPRIPPAWMRFGMSCRSAPALSALPETGLSMTPSTSPAACQVAVYYFPNWHPSPHNNDYYGLGENEWKVVRATTPRFAGHQQPKVPAWGYEDESLPDVMAKKIGAAADHGVDAFIFDWDWYDDMGPLLHDALDQAFL